MDEIELESVEIALKKDDIVVLYTDGVTEACNGNDEEYGVERLQQMIESVRSLSSKEIIAAVVADITTFAGTRPQFDDITLMVLKVE